jgi:hypothetical protein
MALAQQPEGGDCAALVQVDTADASLPEASAPPLESEPGAFATWLNSLPTWSETTQRVQEFSQSTVESLRKNAAQTLRASADALQEGSAQTASKMREAAPWVAGDAQPTVPLVRAEDLRRGDAVFRKGLPAVFMEVGPDAIVVRMDETGNEISTECVHVSLGVEASQHVVGNGVRVCLVGLQNKPELNGCHGSVLDFKADAQRWNVQLDSTGEVLCVNPRNLSALLSLGTADKGTAHQACLEVGAGVRLEGLQNRPQLNGASGVLTEFQSWTSRWNVKLDSAAETICVHPRNILVVSAADPSAQGQK